MRFKDRTVIVTGGGTGIGKEAALMFVEEGANVVIIGRRVEKLREVEVKSRNLGFEIDYLANDISDEDSCKAIVEYVINKYGRIDTLINNAGILLPGATHEISSMDWDKTFNVNVRGLWLMSKFAVPHMMEKRSGAIVNTCSVVGLRGFRGVAAYAASKGAVAQLTRSMALEYASYNVRVNAVCPGFVETPLVTEGYLERAKDRDKAIEFMKSMHPLGRIATAREVAHGILFLCDDDSGFITGHLMPIDGGWTAS